MKCSLEDCVDYNFSICFCFSQNLKKEDASTRLPGKVIFRSFLLLGEALLTLISFNDNAYFFDSINCRQTEAKLTKVNSQN